MASAADSSEPRPPGALLRDVRAGVLSATLTWFALGCPPLCVLVIAQAAALGYASARLWVLVGLALAFVPLRLWHRRIGYRRSAISLLAGLAVVSSYLMILGRLTPGATLFQIMLVLCAVLFLGARAGVAALCFCVASIAVAGVMVVSGQVEPMNAEYWSPLRPVVWVRYALVLALLGGALVAAFARLIAGLEASVARAEQALAREREEREKGERAQVEVERARRVEALGQLAVGIAHDFNNSLTVILATSSLIEQVTTPGSEVFELAAEVREAALASASTAKRLLSLGRHGAAKPTVLSVAALIRSIETPLRRILPANISLGLDVATTQAVLVDSSELEQAMLNLTVNARDAMPDGGKITLSGSDSYVDEVPAGWDAQAGAFVEIACQDTGSGMDAATIDRMFEPFFTTKDPGKGTGLGLAMVRKMALDAHGYVSVKSTIGEGTTIGIFLPRHVRAS